ncbi:extracellular solute-binding protein [Paenibacillus apii]|uniref:extracellular solute-binding protein n=1 Tax=Paenibacillus apii TaxID=1850370 RepID=UPI00143BD182|nr:extracellular solute-binding protein [Paenibacillus apii]NJJ39549.1 extracellular solute-binding protein [Paenibacillus apii]
MQKMKVLVLVFVLAVMTILAGCGAKSSDSGASQNTQGGESTAESSAEPTSAEPTELTVINQDRWAPYVEKAVKIWNEQHPDKQVKLNQLVLGYPQLRQKITTAAAAGQAPDFSLIDSVWVAEFADAGYLKPLDSIDPDWVENDFKKDFYPVFVGGDSYEGKPYAIRSQTDMALIWFRKDWFSQEGIQPPKTWDELMAAAKHFSQKDVQAKYGNSQGIAFPGGMKAGETTTSLLMPFFWSSGADVFKDGKVVLDSTESKAAVQFLTDLVGEKASTKEVISYEWDRATKLLATGKVALSVGGSYEYAMIKNTTGWSDDEMKEKLGFVPIPAGGSGKVATSAGGMDYVIYEQAKQPELAMEILKIVTGPELMKEFVVDTAQNSPRISVTEGLDKDKDWFLAETGKFLYDANVRPVIPEYAKVSEQIQKMIESAVSGKTPADQAVTEAAKAISDVTGLPQQ